eukprot:jgi/Hompol1/890/HPOL_002594-RA
MTHVFLRWSLSWLRILRGELFLRELCLLLQARLRDYNYTPGNANPEIHIRFGTGEVLTSAQIKADNGWVYILQGPIPPESSVTDTLAAQSSNAFANAIKSAGLASYINGLKGYTVFAPSDAAWAAAAGRLASLTPDQVKGTILYHVLSESVVSTALSNRNAQTLLQGQTIAFGVDGENWTLNGGQGKVTTSDFFSAGGVIHLIDSVLTPPAFPAGPIVIPGAGSTTTTAAPVTTATAQRAGDSGGGGGMVATTIDITAPQDDRPTTTTTTTTHLQPNTAETGISNLRSSGGTYFGPNFVFDASTVQRYPGQPLQTTQAFWDEILSVLSGGPGSAETEMAGLGNVYTQAAELKRTTTLQALSAIQKNTLAILRDPASNLYRIEFIFDSIAPCWISLFWNAKQSYATKEDGKTVQQ